MGIIFDYDFVYDINGNAVTELSKLNSTNIYLYKVDLTKVKPEVLKNKRIALEDFNTIVLESSYERPVLIDLSNYDYQTIKFDSPFKMLVSDDKITWHNYLDENKYNAEVIEKEHLEHYLNTYAKEQSFINRRYNYIYIKPNNGKKMHRMYENILLDGVKKTRELLVTFCENTISIHNPTTRIFKRVAVIVVNSKSKILNTIRSCYK